MARQLRHFIVEADIETGEWDEPTLKQIGTVDSAEHADLKDTADIHYDTFENYEAGPDGETCAVTVYLVREEA